MQNPQPVTKPGPQWGRVARWVVATLLVAFLGVMAGAYARAFMQIGKAHTGDRIARRPAADRFAPPLRLLGRVNVLLIGTDITLDTRGRVVPISRADTLMLLSFDPRAGRVFALSIPRDTRAQIPGVGEAKINSAHAFGGVDLTIRAVEDLVGVPVHFYVTMAPAGFAALIDALGGLEIHVERDMRYVDRAAGLRIDLRKGRQVLNGEQTMGYARFRKDALGDIARVDRQQKVVRALVAKLRENRTLWRAPHLMEVVRQHAETNLTSWELATLAWFARVRAGEWAMATLPGQFGPTYWEPDAARLRRVAAEFFYGISPDAMANTTVEVLNGSGIPGAARRTATRLERIGLRVVRVGNAPQIQETSQVIARGGVDAVADLIAQLLGLPAASHGVVGDVDVTVIVARDYAARVSARQP